MLNVPGQGLVRKTDSERPQAGGARGCYRSRAGPCWSLRAAVSSPPASSLSEELELELGQRKQRFAGCAPVHPARPGSYLVTQGRRMGRPAKAQPAQTKRPLGFLPGGGGKYPRVTYPTPDCLLRPLPEKDCYLPLLSPFLLGEPAEEQVGLLARLGSQLRAFLN